MKITPIASYGIQIVWKHLIASHLERFDKLKASYLKRALGTHRTSRNRLVYMLTGAPLLTEHLLQRFGLPTTNNTWKTN